MRRLLGALSLTAALLLAGRAGAQQDFEMLQKGIQPNHLYHFHDLDSVNVLNGNLTINIPIGLTYPLNGGLGYNLVLSYNSNVWDMHEAPLSTTSVPSMRSNAGLGWLLGMGRFIDHNDPSNLSLWDLYESPDGGDHRVGGCSTANCVGYSADDSNIRVHYPSATERDVDTPDGVTRQFQLNPDGRTWSLTRISSSASSDHVDISASNGAGTQCTGSDVAFYWTISDSQGRAHYVCFRNYSVDGQQRPMVDQVKLQSPQGWASYQFTYATQPNCNPNETTTYQNCINRSPLDTNNNSSEFPLVHTAPLLSTITLPDLSTYRMTYNLTGFGTGAVASMTLPTNGTVSYNYTVWAIPGVDICSNVNGVGTGLGDRSVGISSRSLTPLLPSGQPGQTQTWGYFSELSGLHMSVTTCPPAGPDPLSEPAEMFDEMLVTITDPAGSAVRNHFTVLASDELADNPDVHGTFNRGFRFFPYGPYDSTTGLYLSQEIFPCNDVQSCSPVRKIYVRDDYDGPLPTGCCTDVPPTHRLASQRTVFLDDCASSVCNWTQTDNSNWDGFQHYRTVRSSWNFKYGDAAGNGLRTVTTSWNERNGVPQTTIDPGMPWMTNTYEDVTTTEGTDTAVEQSCFDPSTGFLKAKRVLAGAGPGPTDLLSVFTADTSGNLVSESFYGGDNNQLPSSVNTSPLCTAVSSSGFSNLVPDYSISHTWQYGVMATSQYSGASFLSRNLTIGPSGLIAASKDSSGLETDYAYDSSGRLTLLSPPGVAATSFIYTNASPTGSPATVDSVATSALSGEVHKQYQFDSFGRLWREKQHMADNSWSIRETLYDGRWRTKSVSTAATLPPGVNEFDFTPPNVTSYVYDVFDRPTNITAPDGSATGYVYKGISQTKRTTAAATTDGGPATIQTTESYDGVGRLRAVTEASDQTSAFTTNYAYDIGDRLKTVTAGVQTRTFNYDKRGLLSSETHPELGVYGNGTIAYGQYDARGHAHNKKTGTNSLLDLHFTFDAAERLTEVDDSGSALRPLKKFVFATANDTSSSPVDARNGKLYQAIRYNHPPIGDVTVTETYKYTNALGRPSQRDTVVQTAAGTMLQSFTQAFNYDVFGATAGEDFPRCASGLTCGGTPPANSVPFTHNNGFLTAVAPYATSITYNPDASVHRVVHGTTAPVTDSYEPDPSGMSRPSLITFDGFQGCTPPSASVSGDSTITSGSLASIQVVLTGTGPWTLTWSDGSVDHPTSSPFTKNVTPSSTTTYQVTKVSDAHCSAAGTGSATITVNCNPPVATVSGGGSILPGGSVQVQVQFTGTAPWSVTWSDGLAQSGIYSNPLLRTVSPNVTTNYRITAFSDANCAGSGAGNALVTVALATPASFATSAAGYGTTVVFTWSAVSGATWYQIESTDHLGGQFTNVMGRVGAQTGATQTTSLYLPLANPKTYIYRVIAGTTANGTDTISAPSATDYATTGNPLFSDDPPVAGSTHIAGVDLGELRKAIDAVRAAAGLTAAWSSYAAGSGRIAAADVVSMQTNLNDAVFRLTGRYLQYSGEAPASSHPIRAYQWQQLRDGVK